MRLTYQPSSQGVKLAGLRLAAYAQEEKGKEGKCKGNGTASLFRSSGSHNILSISDLRNPLRKRSPPPTRRFGPYLTLRFNVPRARART